MYLNKHIHTILVHLFKFEVLQNFDATIRDVSLLTNHWKIVDFTQP